jgi:diphthine synthase
MAGFNLIGLGLDLGAVGIEAIGIIKKADRVYVESYTVDLPYSLEHLAKVLGKDIFPLTRMMTENEKFVEDAKEKEIVLLVYGSPLMATTHISLLLKCKKENIKYKIFQNASIFDGVAETGLQAYKFGKTTSMPKWEKNYRPESFIDVIKDNKKIKAHTLLLIDIGLHYSDALKQLEEASSNKIKIEKMVVCSNIGTKHSKMYYRDFEELYGLEVSAPFCFIIPGDLHFLEEDALKELSN